MPIIPFPAWLPDAAVLGNAGMRRVVNALPGLNSYKRFPSLSPATNALAARPRGHIVAKSRSGDFFAYAGDATKLYEQQSQTWTDVSIMGGYATADDERWEFLAWKDKILATNFTNNPQQITMGGANFSDLTTDLRMRHLAAVGDHVIAGNTFDGVDGNIPDRLRMSAFNDETNWTIDPNTGADFRDLRKGGAIQRIFGGEFGVVLSETSIFRLSRIAAQVWWQVDETIPDIGLFDPGMAAQFGDIVYAYTEQGFVAISSGTSLAFIGAGKVDDFVRRDFDTSFAARTSTTVDPTGTRVAWAYPGEGHVNGRPNRIIIYDRVFDKWTLIEREVELVMRGVGTRVTLEDPDGFPDNIDTPGAPSLDSAIYQGGGRELAAFDETFKSGFFDGMPMTAIFETGEIEINRGYRTHLNAFRPVVDGGTVTARIGGRNVQGDPIQYGMPINRSATGRFTQRRNARYHTFELTVSGDWSDAIGIQIERDDAPRGELR